MQISLSHFWNGDFWWYAEHLIRKIEWRHRKVARAIDGSFLDIAHIREWLSHIRSICRLFFFWLRSFLRILHQRIDIGAKNLNAAAAAWQYVRFGFDAFIYNRGGDFHTFVPRYASDWRVKHLLTNLDTPGVGSFDISYALGKKIPTIYTKCQDIRRICCWKFFVESVFFSSKKFEKNESKMKFVDYNFLEKPNPTNQNKKRKD